MGIRDENLHHRAVYNHEEAIPRVVSKSLFERTGTMV